MFQKTYKVVLTGGGSGGHIMPLLAVAQTMREKVGYDHVKFLYIGSKGKIEQEAMDSIAVPTKFIVTGKWRRYFSFQNFIDIFKIPFGFLQSLWHVLWFMPDAVFSKGGSISVPVVLAAWIYRIPIITQDSDAVPGMATKILGKLADRVALAYPSAMRYFLPGKAALIGNPIRSNLLSGSAEEGRKLFNLAETVPTIFVFGGGLGSQVINKAIVRILPKLLGNVQIIHQTGDANYQDVVHSAAEFGVKENHGGYHPVAFLPEDKLRHVFAVADMIISRAGANAIAEIAAMKKPAILIPLSTAANDEQRMNAYEIARIGGALVLEETNLGENLLMQRVSELMGNEKLRHDMGEAIGVFYHPEAAAMIVEEILRLCDK